MKFPGYSIAGALLLILMTFSCSMQKKAVGPSARIMPFGDTVHLREGSLVYSLPMTTLNITVDVERHVEKPGPYAKYANDLLGIKEIMTQDKEYWTISGVKVSSATEPDPSEFYVIETTSMFQTNALKLKREGLILDLNPETYDNNPDQAVSRKPTRKYEGFLDLGSDEYFVNQSDTAYRLVKLDTSFIKIPYLVEKKRQLSLDQLAEKAAKSLLELRDGRHLMLSGEANVFPQARPALDEINRLEKEYLALFAGKSWTETRTLTYTIIPQKNTSGKSVPLFMFSPEEGVADLNSKKGVPVSLLLSKIAGSRDMTVITYPKAQDGTSAVNDKLYYRMPQITTVDIKKGEETIYSGRKLIYQLGNIMQLPSNYIIGK
jgi:hypothetical protein